MFLKDSPYSQFFTSGLLSFSDSASALNDGPAPAEYLGPRRGSLPDTSSVSTDKYSSSSFQLAFQARRDANELRSFLSLDLAESQSLRSAAPRSISFSNPFASENSLPTRSSRDSLRAIPSPKPIPSVSLPQLPSRPNRASTSKSPLPQPRFSSAPSVSPAQKRTSSTPVPQKQATESRALTRRPTQQSASTVSTGYRRTKRSDALAQLEGRAKTALKHANFMSLWEDDEDVAKGNDDLDSGFEADSDEESSDDDDDEFLDMFTTISRRSELSIVSVISDDESLIIPVSPAQPKLSIQRPASSVYPSTVETTNSLTGKRKRTPLKSFIDLREREDDTPSQWNWRSFIEIAAVA